MKKIISLVSLGILSACATNPDNISTAYVSPLKYKNYDCDQVAMEMDYIGQRTADLYHSLDKKHANDQWQMGVGLILFWPTLFALEGGDGPEAAEYSRLKGEFEALRNVSIEKKCGLDYKSPEEIIKSREKPVDKSDKTVND